MRLLSGRRVVVAALVAVVLGAVGGYAYASIPGGDGVIDGCYGKITGNLRVIDADAGGACLANERPLSWNQVGPQGPPGPSDAYAAAQSQDIEFDFTTGKTEAEVVTRELPAGLYALTARGALNYNGSPLCRLHAPAGIVDSVHPTIDDTADNNTLRGDQEWFTLVGTAELQAAGTVGVTCFMGFGSATQFKLLAIRVAAI